MHPLTRHQQHEKCVRETERGGVNWMEVSCCGAKDSIGGYSSNTPIAPFTDSQIDSHPLIFLQATNMPSVETLSAPEDVRMRGKGRENSVERLQFVVCILCDE